MWSTERVNKHLWVVRVEYIYERERQNSEFIKRVLVLHMPLMYLVYRSPRDKITVKLHNFLL